MGRRMVRPSRLCGDQVPLVLLMRQRPGTRGRTQLLLWWVRHCCDRGLMTLTSSSPVEIRERIRDGNVLWVLDRQVQPHAPSICEQNSEHSLRRHDLEIPSALLQGPVIHSPRSADVVRLVLPLRRPHDRVQGRRCCSFDLCDIGLRFIPDRSVPYGRRL